MTMRGSGVLAILVGAGLALAAACGGDDGSSSDGGGATGGSATGGSATGGSATGGSATGGSATAGATATGGSGGAVATGGGGAWTPTAGTGPVDIGDPIEVTDDTGTFTCYVTTCASHELQCGNCQDDDGDGLVDSHDPECLGPCDNTEGPGLDSDVGGTTADACKVDCYFDFGNGPGNDNCEWDHRCDTLEPEQSICPYDETMLGGNKCPLEQSALCAEICLPYTPNGCDCFGCCTFPELATAGPDGGNGYVWIGAMDSSNTSTCTLDALTDEALCPPCTPVENCLNPCGPCEVCIGRPTPPPECFDNDAGPPPDQCEGDLQACGLPGQDPCPGGYYCVTGCCVGMLY